MSCGTIDEGKQGCLIDSFPNDGQSEPLQSIGKRYPVGNAGDTDHAEQPKAIPLVVSGGCRQH